MKLSVIIPCKNEAGTVDHLLDSLVEQSHPASEIIVVDSHSTDETVAHVEAFSSLLPVHVITAQQRGVAHARNAGGAHAVGDLLVFIDADAVLPPTFLADLVARIKAKRLQAGGFTMRMQSQKASIRLGARAMNGYLRLMSHTPWPIAFSCIFTTREVFDRLRGFDPELFIMEDYDYALRARRAGYKVGVATSPFIASDRRFIDDPRGSAWKGVYGELYRYTHGLRITKPLFRYDMGGDQKQK